MKRESKKGERMTVIVSARLKQALNELANERKMSLSAVVKDSLMLTLIKSGKEL